MSRGEDAALIRRGDEAAGTLRAARRCLSRVALPVQCKHG